MYVIGLSINIRLKNSNKIVHLLMSPTCGCFPPKTNKKNIKIKNGITFLTALLNRNRGSIKFMSNLWHLNRSPNFKAKYHDFVVTKSVNHDNNIFLAFVDLGTSCMFKLLLLTMLMILGKLFLALVLSLTR